MLSPKCGDETQHHKLFRSRCTVQVSLCDLIIYRSLENIISKYVVKRLQLEIETHHSLYAIGWIKEVGGIHVKPQKYPRIFIITLLYV